MHVGARRARDGRHGVGRFDTAQVILDINGYFAPDARRAAYGTRSPLWRSRR